MARTGFTAEQQWLLGQLDAPARAARIQDLLRQQLRPLGGVFSARASEGGVSVALGPLTLIGALCEADPQNGDTVWNHVASRSGPGEYESEMLTVVDKSNTGRVAREQLERALNMLRLHHEEFAALGLPMAWVHQD